MYQLKYTRFQVTVNFMPCALVIGKYNFSCFYKNTFIEVNWWDKL